MDGTHNPPEEVSKGLDKHVKAFKNSGKIGLKKPLRVEHVDTLMEEVAKAPQLYVHRIQFTRKYRRRNGIFHDPSAISSPLCFAYKDRQGNCIENEYNGCWYFFGGRLSSTYIHFDMPEFSVINTQLNNGLKLWIIVHPEDTWKLVRFLQKISGEVYFLLLIKM